VDRARENGFPGVRANVGVQQIASEPILDANFHDTRQRRDQRRQTLQMVFRETARLGASEADEVTLAKREP
jgi:hypothetical protein